jgi:DNA-binding NarL/FixJ family response regulator
MRVALADDSALFRDGLALLLNRAGIEVVIQARTGDELLARLRVEEPDVAIVDIRMPPTFTNEGLEAAQLIRERYPSVGVLVLSTYAETAYAVQLLASGQAAIGYLLKDRVDDVATLRDALSRIAQGETVIDPDIVRRLVSRQRSNDVLGGLSSRERQVLELMAEGRSNAGIARHLHLGTKTVEGYIASLFRHLDIPESSDDNRRVLVVLTWLRTLRAPDSAQFMTRSE